MQKISDIGILNFPSLSSFHIPGGNLWDFSTLIFIALADTGRFGRISKADIDVFGLFIVPTIKTTVLLCFRFLRFLQVLRILRLDRQRGAFKIVSHVVYEHRQVSTKFLLLYQTYHKPLRGR